MMKNRQKKKEEAKEMQVRDILDIFVAMMQKLSTGQNMERVEVRTRISNFITHLLENMKEIHRVAFVSFMIRLCSSKVSSHRIFGVELLGSILTMDWVWEHNLHSLERTKKQLLNHDITMSVDDSEESSKNEISRTSFDVNRRRCSSTEFPRNQPISFLISEECKTNKNNHISREMLTALHNRVMDRSPAVRARVATALSTAFRDIKTLVGKSEEKLRILNATVDDIGPNLISSLQERASSDEKATVRKAALLAFVDLLLMHESDENEVNESSSFMVTENDVNVLCQLCNDQSVSVRKTAMDSLVSFLERQHYYSESSLKYESGSLENAWVNFILPLVRDVEPSCVSKVVESFETLIVAPIFDMNSWSEISDNPLLTRKYKSAWKILSTINHESFSTGASTGVKNALKLVMGKSLEVQDVYQRKRICMAFLKEVHSIITGSVDNNQEDNNEKFIGAWCLLESIGSLNSHTKTKELINLKDLVDKSDIGTDFLPLSCISLLEKSSQEDMGDRMTALIVSARSCLHVISSFAHVMNIDQIKTLALSLKESTKSFNLILDLIGPSTTALVSLATAICRGKPESTIGSTCTDWIKE